VDDRSVVTHRSPDDLGMRGIPVSEKYRGIQNDGIIHRGLAKYRGIPSGGADWATVCRTVHPMLSDRCPVCDIGVL